jgi:hypothetical protein
MPYRILVQGMTPDMSYANGDYDSSYEYQVNTPEELLDVLRRVQPLQVPAHPPEVDMCPPNLVVDLGAEQFTFMPDQGHLFCTNANGFVTPEQGLQLITTPGTSAVVRQAVQQQSGVAPARMAHIPPTDRENFYHDHLDMGPHQPQVHFPLQRDHDSKSDIVVWGIVGVVLMGLGVVMMGSGAAVPGLVVCAFGALSGYASRRSAARLNIVARVGLDWNGNAMWSVVDGSEVPGYLLDANLLVDVVAIQGKDREDMVFVPGEATVAGGGTHKFWDLRFTDVQGQHLILDLGLRFYRKDQLEYAMNAIRGLLASQR